MRHRQSTGSASLQTVMLGAAPAMLSLRNFVVCYPMRPIDTFLPKQCCCRLLRIRNRLDLFHGNLWECSTISHTLAKGTELVGMIRRKD